MSKKTKIILIALIVILAIVVVVIMKGGSSSTPENTSGLNSLSAEIPLPGAPTSQAGNDEFSLLLSSINRITIDTGLFQNPAYILLRDHPVVLGTDLVGRINPFAPIGSDGPIQLPGSAELTVQTLQPAKVTSTSAEFGAQIILPGTTPINLIFEYGTSDLFGSATAPTVATKSGVVLVSVSKLLPDTTYYVRAVAVRGAETTTAQTMTFITPKAPVKR